MQTLGANILIGMQWRVALRSAFYKAERRDIYEKSSAFKIYCFRLCVQCVIVHLFRSGAKLKSLGSGGNADLNVMVSELKDMRESAKGFMNAQNSGMIYDITLRFIIAVTYWLI